VAAVGAWSTRQPVQQREPCTPLRDLGGSSAIHSEAAWVWAPLPFVEARWRLSQPEGCSGGRGGEALALSGSNSGTDRIDMP
jgi:hypothetical protein